MALRVAVATGNWSNPAIWNAGVLPQSGDVVASNGFTVTIDQNINVDLITNTVQSPVIITPVMTSNTTPSGIVTASSIFQVTYDSWRAFDRGGQDWLTGLGAMTGWVAYEFPTVKVVAKYQMFPPGNGSPTSVPRDWTFEGWTGSAWVVLDTVTGNSGSASVTRNIPNTTAYIKYRLNITANNGNINYTGVYELYLYEANDFAANSVAGGGFVLNSGVTCTLTNTTAGVFSNSTTPCITYSATSGTSTINGIMRGSINSHNGAGVLHSGSATLNINGDIQCGTHYAATNNPGVRKSGTGTLNIVGNLYTITDSNGNSPLYNTGTGTINITGIIYGHQTSAGYSSGFQNTEICTINITGNLIGGGTGSTNASPALFNNVAASIYITGNIYARLNQPGLHSTGNHYLSVVGSISSNFVNPNTISNPALVSTSGSAINLFTGPFVCSPYGFFPYQVNRMHLIPTTSSYIEFRDETTNGAGSPGAIAPATQLVSPATLISNLATSDVRFGIVYALGTLTGTLRMPVANQVTFGIPVDATSGNAVLTAASIWDYLVSNITTADSIGMRLKNVATPQTTGEQLEAFLRLD